MPYPHFMDTTASYRVHRGSSRGVENSGEADREADREQRELEARRREVARLGTERLERERARQGGDRRTPLADEEQHRRALGGRAARHRGALRQYRSGALRAPDAVGLRLEGADQEDRERARLRRQQDRQGAEALRVELGGRAARHRDAVRQHSPSRFPPRLELDLGRELGITPAYEGPHPSMLPGAFVSGAVHEGVLVSAEDAAASGLPIGTALPLHGAMIGAVISSEDAVASDLPIVTARPVPRAAATSGPQVVDGTIIGGSSRGGGKRTRKKRTRKKRTRKKRTRKKRTRKKRTRK